MLERIVLCFCLLFCVLSAQVWAKDAHVPEQKQFSAFALDQSEEQIFVPNPPDSDSELFLHDKARYEQGKALRNTERGLLAVSDVDTHSLPEFFSEPFGASISKETLPVLYNLMQRVRKTLGKSTDKIKKNFWRMRPYVLYGDTTCYPQSEARLSKQSSYPSGHSVRGWGLALLLSEINPERAVKILERGFEYGQSRVLCGYHWQSDVDAGRLLASVLYARLHANADFQAELEKAKAEYAQWQKRQKPDTSLIPENK